MSGKVELKSLYATSTESDSESGAHISRMGEVERFSPEELDQLKLIYAGTSNFSVLNIFRELRTQLLQKQKKKIFVCMVTSTSHNGGASFIASNLASVFALDKAKTSMLIDANLYSPGVDRFIIGDAEVGLTDFLSENVSDIKDVVYATGVPRLRAVPLGGYSEGAAEYFSSTRMAAFIEEVKGRYPDRYVFIDAPPVLQSSESRILAEQVDMVLLVVPHAKTTIDEISSAIEVIGKDKLAGLVYND